MPRRPLVSIEVWQSLALAAAVTAFIVSFIHSYIRPEPVFVFPHPVEASDDTESELEHDRARIPISGLSVQAGDIMAVPYRLISVDGISMSDRSNYSLSFSGDVLRASICNSFFGSYTLRPHRLTASLSSTEMYCPSGQTTIENNLIDSLTSGAPIWREGQELVIMAGGIEYRYAPKE